VYTTLEDMRHAKKIKLSDEKQGHYHFKQISRYDIVNALTDTSLPLSDDIHGPYRMTPPELLHTSGSGIISYMFNLCVFRLEVVRTVMTLTNYTFKYH
jgi:hypothetical protein